ncbi:MAG: RidA family protein [Candidatus Lokiarchaeota archaeon]|nr:RidA family protein [Candidatus Lokiarchaeota archaeon]
MKVQITSDNAPAAIGPYSQAIDAGPLVFLSGQLPLDTAGRITGQDIESQTKQAFSNIAAILQTAGLDLGHVVKCQVFMTNLGDFGRMNAVYEATFKPFGTYPARTTVQAGALPKGALIEIDAIATKDRDGKK